MPGNNNGKNIIKCLRSRAKIVTFNTYISKNKEKKMNELNTQYKIEDRQIREDKSY